MQLNQVCVVVGYFEREPCILLRALSHMERALSHMERALSHMERALSFMERALSQTYAT